MAARAGLAPRTGRRRPAGRGAGAGRARWAALALLLALPSAPADALQEGGPPADTLPAPADTLEAGRDTARRMDPAFPALPEATDSLAAGASRTWDRQDLLNSTALTVAGFLADEAPGLLPLRANVHQGPHHLVDGVLGPGFVQVVVNGRMLPPLASGQVDLSRLALARVDRLRLVRRAGGIRVEVTTPSHRGGEAYSRIAGGTGQPSADMIRGVFTNGAGRHFTVGASVEHLSIGAGSGPGNRLDAWGELSWMPFDDNDSGLQFVWHSDVVTRTAAEEEDFDRREVLLHARADLAEGIQVDVWGGRSTRSPGPVGAGVGPGTDGGGADLAVPHAELGISVDRGPVTVRGDARVRSAQGLADLEADLRGAVRLGGGLWAEGGAGIGWWSDFTASRYSGALAFRPEDLSGLVLRVEGATGLRGVARPGRSADSVAFDALAGSARVALGPYSLTGRATRRSVERQLPFGGDFDAALSPGPRATVLGFEGRAEGPLVPMEPLEARLRVRGTWRHNESRTGPLPLYVPADLARGELSFRGQYFGGNLGVRVALGLRYRGPMRSAAPGSAEPVVLEEESSLDSSVVIRVDTFRLWWRVDNIRRGELQDFGTLSFPPIRNVFGVKWEFFE